jgi:hypothetical protein
MELSEQIIAFAGTGIGSVLVGNWINKKRDKIEITLKEQIFYKNLIQDIQETRDKERVLHENQIKKLAKEIKGLKDSIIDLIEVKKEQEKTIKQLRIERKRWEESASNDRSKYTYIIQEKDKQICKLFDKVEQYENK